jgi:hypothetical protein
MTGILHPMKSIFSNKTESDWLILKCSGDESRRFDGHSSFTHLLAWTIAPIPDPQPKPILDELQRPLLFCISQLLAAHVQTAAR